MISPVCVQVIKLTYRIQCPKCKQFFVKGLTITESVEPGKEIADNANCFFCETSLFIALRFKHGALVDNIDIAIEDF